MFVHGVATYLSAYETCRNFFGDRTTRPCHSIPSAARLRVLGAPPRANELLALLRYFVLIPGRAGLTRGSIAKLERFFRGEIPRSAAPGWVLFAENEMLRLIDDVRNEELEFEGLAQRFECDTKGPENMGQLLPGGGQERREAHEAVQIEAAKWRRVGLEVKDQSRRVAESEMLWRRGEDREVLTDRIGEEQVERVLKLIEKMENKERERVRRLREEAGEERIEEVRPVVVQQFVPPEWMRDWGLEPRSWLISVLVFLLGFWLASLYET